MLLVMAVSGDLPGSPYSYIAAGLAMCGGLLLLGWSVGWPSLWLFSVALAVFSVVYQRLLWSGDSQIGPSAVVLGLPLAWAVLALGAVARRHRPRRVA